MALALAAGAFAAINGLESPAPGGDPAPGLTLDPGPTAAAPQAGGQAAAETSGFEDKAAAGENASHPPGAATPGTEEWYSGRRAARPAPPPEAAARSGDSEPALALQWDPGTAGLEWPGEAVPDALAPQPMLPDEILPGDWPLAGAQPAGTGDDGEEAGARPWSGLAKETQGLPGGGLVGGLAGTGPAPAGTGGTAGGTGNLGIGN